MAEITSAACHCANGPPGVPLIYPGWTYGWVLAIEELNHLCETNCYIPESRLHIQSNLADRNYAALITHIPLKLEEVLKMRVSKGLRVTDFTYVVGFYSVPAPDKVEIARAALVEMGFTADEPDWIAIQH